jgi:hypothetical protein
MNAQMRRFRAAGLALLVLLHSLFAAAQTPLPKVGKVYTDYGVESEMRIPSRILGRTITRLPPRTGVAQLRSSPLIFDEAGGVMFDAVARPCAGLAGEQLRLSYDRTKPDGRRLTLHAGASAYAVAGVPDRHLRPIAEFANSDVPVLTNLQYPDETVRRSCPLPAYGLRLVTLHPAFLNTELGRHLTFMDAIPWSFSEGKRWQSEEPLPAATASLSKSLALALKDDSADYTTARLRGRDKYPFVSLGTKRVSNINDNEAPPTFCAGASTVRLDGLPRLEFIAPWYVGNYALPRSSRLMTQNISQLRLVDQEAYDAVVRIYRLGGLFRYVKRQSPAAWRQFLISLPPKERRDTYTIVCPGCTRAELEDWLGCVEEHFPSPRPAGRTRKR